MPSLFFLFSSFLNVGPGCPSSRAKSPPSLVSSLVQTTRHASVAGFCRLSWFLRFYTHLIRLRPSLQPPCRGISSINNIIALTVRFLDAPIHSLDAAVWSLLFAVQPLSVVSSWSLTTSTTTSRRTATFSRHSGSAFHLIFPLLSVCVSTLLRAESPITARNIKRPQGLDIRHRQLHWPS